MAQDWLTPISLFCPSKKPLTQRPSWSGSEAPLGLPCFEPYNEPWLCCKHLLSEFGFLCCGHTSPCSATVFFNLFLYYPIQLNNSWHFKGNYNFPGGSTGKEPACQCRRHKWCEFNPWVRKIPWKRKWQPAPVYLPGKFHGQRKLVG